MEEFSSMIAQNSDNAANTNEIASSSSKGSTEGKEIINQSLEAMKAITGKIKLIEAIAFQTILLSLNASIEATRAG